ncbi:MAG: DinB family protein [Flavobacteriales bacterium]|jgi:uncharacterized damage-inducible protein DinB|nr:DinB family protein [Flavobacteriales bacterium]
MSMHPLLSQLTDYSVWANTLFVERLREEREELLDTPVASSFPSLRATLMHIRDGENAWLHRLLGRTPIPWPAEPDMALTTLLPYTQRLRDLVHGSTDAWLAENVVYHDLRGSRHEQPRWHMILHCCNHGTQHRGQLITMMRALGLDRIPATDLIKYQRSLLSE